MEYPENILKHSKTISEGLEGFGISKGEFVPCGFECIFTMRPVTTHHGRLTDIT